MCDEVEIMKVDEYGFCHLNFAVSKENKDTICRLASENGMNLTDFIAEKSTKTEIPDSKKLKKIKAKYPKDYEEKAKAFLNEIKNGDKCMNKPNGASKKTEQFHLRVTPEAYSIIQDRADKLSMSVSDYVTFITTRFDIEEVSLKMDKIISMLEK